MPLAQILQSVRNNAPLNLVFVNDLFAKNNDFNYPFVSRPAPADSIGGAAVDTQGIVKIPGNASLATIWDARNWRDGRAQSWHATLEVGTPVASAEFLVGAFEGLGDRKRDVLKLAARFRGDEAFLAGVGEEEALDIVLPWLSEERLRRLCGSALEIYIQDRIGTEN